MLMGQGESVKAFRLPGWICLQTLTSKSSMIRIKTCLYSGKSVKDFKGVSYFQYNGQ